MGFVFFFYQLSLWVNTASPGENDRVAEAPGNIGAVALHRHRPSSVLASCRTGFPAAHWGLKLLFCCPGMSMLFLSLCNTLLYSILKDVQCKSRRIFVLLGQSSIMLSVYGTKTDELLILQFNCRAAKQNTFFSLQ